MNSLEVKNLSYQYSKNSFILKGLNFSLKQGDLMAILGSTGSGKTTLLRLLCGLEKVCSGEIFFNGVKFSCCCFHKTPLDRNCSMVFQNFALFPHLNVKENILFGVKDKKNKKKNLMEMAELLEIYDLLDKPLQFLSGGQQQKVALARSLATKPSFIFLDEPFSHLDISTKQKLFSKLKKFFTTYNMTVVYTSHNIQDVQCFSNKISLLKNGSFEFLGLSKDFFENTKSLYRKEFL